MIRERKSRVVPASRISLDAELAAFIVSRIGQMTQVAIRAEVAAQFPVSRVPSKSALNRFICASATPEQRAATGQRVSR